MKKLLIILLTLTLTSAAFAEKVTKQQALEKAQNFFKGKRLESTTKNLARGAEKAQPSDTTQEDYYVFNAEDNGGFVIISGDDRTPEVLGYADNGRIDTGNLPPNLKGWLEEYSKQINALGTIENSRTRAHTRTPSTTPKVAIEPLITTKWGQGNPYNNQCPEIDGKHCVTGCVATAMAQVMYYHKWPQEACPTIPQYTTGTRQIEMPALPPTTFNWSAMRDRYWEGEQGESADAVAELMRYCGQAVEMNYNVDESGAFEMPRHLIQYFGYSKNAKFVTMSQYTMSQWEDILYKELSEGRPMLYGGCSLTTAHEFICDGYDGDGYYHFNWGWNGDANGFFLLSSMFNEAIWGGYVSGQTAIIGLEPDNGASTIPYIYGYHGGDLTQTEYLRSSTSENFSNISLTEGAYIQYEVAENQDVTLEYGLGLYKDTQLLSVLDQSSAILSLNSNTVYKQTNVAFGKDLENGIYQIRSIYKFSGDNDWEACADSYINYIVATISANNLTLRKVSEIGTENATYTVNNVNYSCKFGLHRPVVAIVNLTNTGDTNQEMIFFWVKNENGGLSFIASACGSIEPGKTGDVSFPIHSLELYDKDEQVVITADPNGSRIMWEDTYHFSKGVAQHLICNEYHIDNYSYGVLRDNEFHLTLNLTNSGENIYDDVISYEFQEYVHDGSGYFFVKDRKSIAALINPGETKDVEIVIPHLENNNSYNLYLTYYGEWEGGGGYGYSFNELPSYLTFLVANNTIEIDGLNYSYTPSSKTASVIPGDYKKIESLSIPSTITVEGVLYSVTEIAPKTFKECHFQSVSLPKGVMSIGSDAFQSSEIKSISLPSTLKHIGPQAFYFSKGIKELSIPEGVTICGAAFRECQDLEILRFPSTLISIDNDIILNCKKLKSVYSAMTDPVKVSEYAFIYRDFNTMMEIPPSATLYVPKGSVSKYQEAVGWNVFTRITDKLPYKLTYYVDGEIYKSYMIEENTGITPEEAPTKEGHAFSDWSEIPETMPAHDVTVTGSFAVNKYKLIYKVDNTDYKTVEIDYGAEISPEEAPTKEGHTFSGWSEIPKTMPAHDVTVTGTFSINKYALTYTVDGDEYKSNEVEYGANITPEAVPTKEGYTFSGWSEIPETMPAHDVTVTGVFYKKGDANGDNTVNAADIVEIVNYIEGNPSEIFNKTAADMNGDKEIDSTDLEGVVNSIMEKE